MCNEVASGNLDGGNAKVMGANGRRLRHLDCRRDEKDSEGCRGPRAGSHNMYIPVMQAWRWDGAGA